MSHGTRVLRLAGFVLGGLLAAAAALLAAAWAAANSEAGRDWLAARLEAAASVPGERRLRIERLQGPLPQRVVLHGIEVSDAEGPWLAADRVELAWRPLALIAGRLHVERVVAGEVDVRRRPAPAAPEEERAAPGGPALPRPPLPVRLDRLAVETLRLQEPVLGQAAVLALEGRAAAPDARVLRSSLTLRRTDGAGGRLAVEAALRPEARALELEVSLAEPAGGLIARALELPGLPPVEASLKGEGPLADWRGRLDGRLGELASLDAGISVTGPAPTLAVDGRADVAGLLAPQAARLLGGPVDVRLRLRRADERAFVLKRARLATATLEVRLRGRLAAARGEVDAAVDLTLRDAAPVNELLAPASIEGASLHLTASGPLQRPSLHAEAAFERLAAPQAALDGATLTADFEPEGGPLRGRLRLAGRAARLETTLDAARGFDGAGLDWRLDGRLDAAARQLQAATLRLHLADLRARLEGGLDLDSGAGDAALHLTLGDMQRLNPLVGLGLEGRGEVDGHLGFGPGEPMLQGTLAGEVRGARVRAAEILDALFAGRTALSADVAIAPDGALRLSRAEIAGPRGTVRGTLAFPADFARIDAELEGSVPEVGALSPALGVALAGRATARARLTGPAADPELDGRLVLKDAAVEGVRLETLEADIAARETVSGIHGRVALAAGGPLGRVRGEGDMVLADGSFRITGASLEGDGFTVERAALAMPTAGGPMRGEAEAKLADLGPLASLAGLRAAGSGSLTLSLFPADGGQGAEATAELREASLRLGDGEPLRLGAARLSLAGRDVFAAPRGRAELKATRAALGPARLADLRLTAEGDAAALDVRLAARGDVLGPTALEAEGRLAVAGERTQVTLSRLQGTLADRELELQRPAELAYGPDGARVDGLSLALAGGRLRLDGALGDRVEATLEAKALPLSLAGVVLARPTLSGTLDGRASLEGPAAAPAGSFELDLTQAGAAEADALPPVDLRLQGRLDGRRLSLSGTLEGLSAEPARLQAQLPLAVSARPPALDFDRDGPLRAELAWQGEVAPLMPLIPVSGHRLTGRGELALQASGSPARPAMSGHLTLAEGEYENLVSGTLLRDLELRVEADGRRLQLARLTARDAAKGRVQASGTLRLAPEAGFPLELRLRAKEATLVRRDEVTAQASGEVAVAGPLDDLLLSGGLKVDRAELRIPDRLPPEVVELEVVEVGPGAEAGEDAGSEAPAPGAEAERRPPAAPGRLRLDVTVTMPGRVFVRGRGLDTEWSGELRVTDTAAEPVVEGELQSVRGQVAVLGKSFALTRGQVSFTGGREIDPELLAVAEHGAEDLQVTVEVSGPLSRPKLAISSVPELPQDEIVARLMFGKSASQLSAIEAAQLAAAVAELSGAGSPAGGVLDRIRDLVGVDVLRVGGEGGGGPSVTAGKYVTEEVFVGVEQGMTPESSTVSMEVEVTPNIVVESDVGRTGAGNVGVKFKWDY